MTSTSTLQKLSAKKQDTKNSQRGRKKSALLYYFEEEIKSIDEEFTDSGSDKKYLIKLQQNCKKGLEALDHLPTTITDNPSTLGFFIRNRYLLNRAERIHKLIEIKAPTIILINEFWTYHKILTSPKPIQHFQKFAHYTFISFIEKTGRRGRTYLEITTNNGLIYLFNSRFGLFLKAA